MVEGCGPNVNICGCLIVTCYLMLMAVPALLFLLVQI